MRVQFATDRALSGSLEPAARFSRHREPEERLRLGVCEVSIPREHRMGALEERSIWKLELRDDPAKHVVITRTTLLKPQAFYKQLSADELIVFVHGYRTTFADAVRRAAQIKYDLSFGGQIIAYSWPSRGTLDGYTIDEANVDWTAPHLQAFLSTLARKSGTKAIHIIAHSMGNRVLGKAVEKLAASSQGPLFNQIILAAPDVDATVFKRDIAPAMKQLSRNVTLYASANDQALLASKRVHGYARAGEAGTGIVTAPGIDTIDVSDVDTSMIGHSYVGDNRTVLSDLFCILRGAGDAKKRCGLEQRGGYWRFIRAFAESVDLARFECKAALCGTGR